MTDEVADAPFTIDVPSSSLGMIIGRGGQTIKRLIQATGCKIEVPKGSKSDEDRPITIELQGSAKSRREAATAIGEVLSGGEAEDHAARLDGAMVVSHDLESRDRQSWLQWRLTAYEREFGVRTEVGRRAVRVWAEKRGGLVGEVARRLRSVIDLAIQQAKELAELEVAARIDLEPENAHYDKAVAPLVDQYGVLVWVPTPEDGVVKLRITGPTEPAQDAAFLLEAKYVHGKFTASVLQVSGQVQSMSEAMAGDFANDIRSLESEYNVRMKESAHILWLTGENAEGVENARRMLVDMLPFYLPDGFFMLEGLPQDVVNEIKMDSGIRNLMAKPECAIAFDRIQGTAWICGSLREQVKARISEMVKKWESEHWETDLEDYGVAMWLLGPQGSGQWLHRMETESRAKIKVCPNALKAWVEGKPHHLEVGKRLVTEGIERMNAKRTEDEANGGRTYKVKEVLSDVPPHMRAIMEKLAMLEAMKKGGKPPAELLRERGLIDERERSRSRSRSKTRDDDASGAATTSEVREVMEWNPATGEMEGTSVSIERGP